MDLNSDKLITLAELKQFLLNAKAEDLSYIMGRYGGPHNALLRNKKFEYDAARVLTRLVTDSALSLEIDKLLSE